jgi:hypothetical protein
MTATIVGPGGTVDIGNEVEIKNDTGNPLPVVATNSLVRVPWKALDVTAMSGDDIVQVKYYSDVVGGTQVATVNITYSAPGVLDTVAVTYP